MAGFSTPASPGITKLSQLTIDADKPWVLKGISNIKELALAMVQGDILVHDGTRIIRLPAGNPNYVLTSGGPGLMINWGPPGLYFNRFYPATISQSLSVVKETPDKSYSKAAPITSQHVNVLGDAPGSYLKLLSPTISRTLAAAIETADKSKSINAPVHTHYDLQIVVDGGIADDGGALTDETAQAQSTAVNDMTLLPAAPALGDAYDFGHTHQFDVVRLNIGIAGVGIWTITWKYWNGAWTNLAGVVDGTNGFMAAAGWREMSFTRPGDWALTNISGHNLYWVRAEVTAFTNLVTQPKGTQAMIRLTT